MDMTILFRAALDGFRFLAGADRATYRGLDRF